MSVLDKIPWWAVLALALTLGLAPFSPEPHIAEKLRMLAQGALKRPVDMLDLALHATPFLLLAAKIARQARR